LRTPNSGSITTIFQVDVHGRPVSDDIKREVRENLTSYMIDMINEGEMPLAWTDLGLKRRNDWLSTIERKHPWLRLCAGHWKGRQIWINNWKEGRAEAIKTSIVSRHAKGSEDRSSPIDIDNSIDPPSAPKGPENKTPIGMQHNGSNSSTRSKRKHQDDLAISPAKKQVSWKGKEREPGIIGFHHPKVSLKKKTAKIAKVTVFLPLCHRHTEDPQVD
jgi:hypothetical protein